MKALTSRRNCWVVLPVISCLFIIMGHIEAQTQPAKQPVKIGNIGLGEWIAIFGVLVGLAGLVFGIYHYLRRQKEMRYQIRLEHDEKKRIKKEEQKKQALTFEEQYREALRKELGSLRMVGPEFESQPVTLEDTFVSLRLSQTWRCEERFENLDREIPLPGSYRGEEGHLSPGQVMAQAFPQFQLLLVVGDPGSGKTTLLKYYALTCLDNRQQNLGFAREKILPLFFPLRELKFLNESPLPLQDNLEAWAKKRYLDIPAQEFLNWLKNSKTLVLLDGLDEISNLEKRQQVCQWIENALVGLKKTCFVLTTRPTGYRKIDGLELECDHLRADILDFSAQQQERFLFKWFRAVFLNELPANALEKEKDRKEKEARDRAQAIIDFLNREENKSVRELARVPMLLQIMAFIWKDRDYLPGSRAALYDISLNYLLEYRDQRRNLKPVLPAEKARIVLSRLALWMQEKLRSDNAAKSDVHQFIFPILQTMDKQPEVSDFCQNLRDRAGLIADYGRDRYIFRHKSFMEFMVALQLLIECRENKERINIFVDSFNDDWWEEPLRFFISKSDESIFERFMRCFFQSEVIRQLDANKQTLLQHLVREAPQKKINALVDSLNSGTLNDNQRRYVMDCLKIIGTGDAVKALEAFIKKSSEDEANLEHARDIVAELTVPETVIVEGAVGRDILTTIPGTFRNPFEDNVEYIKIPGCTFKFSVTGKMETIPGLYFCKYPVTNKRYRRFITFLAGKESKLLQELPLELYGEKLLKYAESIIEYKEYLGKNPGKWPDLLRSNYDDDKRFNGDDQPVVGINWYAARAYCFWLSCLETVINRGRRTGDVKQVAGIYRLPTEEEWEWAAGGEPDGSIRQYPWPQEKGEPTTKLANYGGNVGATTPVGRYPEGATPLGLMDMAGNAWEWMENLYKEESGWRALRGGSWDYYLRYLRCSARLNFHPSSGSDVVGFRVVRRLLPQS
jgi:formylglycine-generating enzyme required for sulfatase activity